MLKSWTIENFKPIIKSSELKFSPVTVLAGRNSSGKSSLLQSILMVAQTLGSKVVERPLLPTGLNVQLGTFEDILNAGSSLRTLIVGFELDFETEKAPPPEMELFVRNKANITSVRIVAVFNSARGNATSSSAIEAAKVVVEKVSLEINGTQVFFVEIDSDRNFPDLKQEVSDINLLFTIDKLSDHQLKNFLEKVEADYLRFVPYSGEQANYIGHFEHQNEKAQEPVLVALSHFLPTRLVHKYKAEERRLRSFRTNLSRAISRILSVSDKDFTKLVQSYSNFFNTEAPISEDMREAIQKFCEAESIGKEFSGQTLLELIVWARSIMRTLERRASDRSNKGKVKVQKLLLQCIHSSVDADLESHKDTEGLEIFVNDNDVESINQSVEQITSFFTSKIRYLGPLRADPQASQKFAPSSELDDVGAKGEYAAAVYEANQNASIEWYNPQKKQVERRTLQNALDIWAKYLGVANQVRTEMGGISGVAWKVILKEGQKARSLPEVGVGVSQILPILVMGLLSPSNILLIIEQPELHLHPGVQARLGDFFVSLSKCKKQCLIETHSENLVSQLRYHMVQSGGQEESGCVIYFVDQDEKGAAKFEPVMISPQGNILNWPDGFFDETMLQEDRITAAGIKRRANKVKNG